MLAGLPASSPNLSISNPSLSPVGSSEEGRAVSPLPTLPHRLSFPPTSLSSESPRVPHHALDPSHFISQAEAAAGIGSSPLSSLAGYPRLPPAMMALSGVPGLGSPYGSGDQNPYASLENFYNPLANPYSLKEAGGPSPGAPSPAEIAAWTQSSAMAASAYGYPYDSSALAAYGYGGAYGLAATRKNVTRESTATLKAWLNEHKKNPYPTKGEKIMLAIISKMTLTQVSCWFANARRRLKKENKMTWEPKNGLNDEDVDVSDEEEQEHSFKDEKPHQTEPEIEHHQIPRPPWMVTPGGVELTPSPPQKDGIPLPPTKPRIWSMAEMAVSKPSYSVGCT